METKCGWNDCKFNEGGKCLQDVHFVSRNHPSYHRIYNLNSEEIRQNCRCLYPDLGQSSNSMLREVIANAVKVAKADGYNQIIYSDENGYAFSRDFPSNHMYKKENVIGKVVIKWENGVMKTDYVFCNTKNI